MVYWLPPSMIGCNLEFSTLCLVKRRSLQDLLLVEGKETQNLFIYYYMVVYMKCMTVKEIDTLLEKMSKNINNEKNDVEINETNEELNQSLHDCLEEAKNLFEEKSSNESFKDENLCSLDKKTK